MEIALAHYLTLRDPSTGFIWAFQNFWTNHTDVKLNIPRGGGTELVKYEFLPFGFNGSSINRQGDNKSANLLFPNTDLTRPWIDVAISRRYFATVRTLYISDTTTPSSSIDQILFTYVGIVTSGQWDDTTATLEVNSVLDAVGGDVPTRRITRKVTGSLPLTSRVRI